MRRSHRVPAEYPPAPRDPPPNASKSPAPWIVVDVWCGLIDHMDRPALDRFTRDIWRRFDHADLEPLKAAILRRRRVLATQGGDVSAIPQSPIPK
jgi:hypothetical protein